jgi:hypothetical protein
MRLICAHCNHPLEFSGPRPLFCAYCGQPLGQADAEATAPFTPGEATVPPAEAAPADTAPPPERVGGYRLLRRLGGGGMGEVYEAEDPASSRHVALKLLAPGSAGSPEAVERFRREGRLASLLAHPRCVFLLAADEDAGRPYIVMELMPGRTLNDLVRGQGPLPPGEAVALILDVIEGLQEAHALGLIHRDVKPSNCFLEPGGRVKVGDFGLARSLADGGHLTTTGTFVGTPLFAAPEQVRREDVDRQADVYSTAATLYFLLTGRAPHQTADALATMARIVSHDAPPVRSLRSAVPAALDRVVLRGLERDRGRRWRDLEELRRALLPFVPGRLSIGSLGLRFAAYLIDAFLLQVASFLLGELLAFLRTGVLLMLPDAAARAEVFGDPVLRFIGLVPFVVGALYFAVLESRGGCSLGKRLLGLRVRRARGDDPPGAARALARTLVFYTLLDLQMLYWAGVLLGLWAAPAGARLGPDQPGAPAPGPLVPLALVLAWVGGRVLVVCTMRARNGYRGLHELASGTRVVQLPAAEKRRSLRSRLAALRPPAPRPAAKAESVGPYAVVGTLWEGPDGQVLLAEDPGLGRKVWVWLRSASRPVLPAARREVSRTGRLRWLAGGTQADARWDAFLAPSGCALADLVRAEGRLPWPDAGPLLQGLAEELAAAEADQTLPPSLSPGQLSIQASGRILLLDMPADVGPAGDTDTSRAVTLLREATVLLLEGELRPTAAAGPVRAPLPGPARGVLDRLLGGRESYANAGAVQADLQALRDSPAEVTPSRRLAHLAFLTAFLSLGLFVCMAPVSVVLTPNFVRVLLLENAIDLRDDARKALEEGSPAELAAGAVQPDPLVRLAAVARWAADRQVARQLAQDRRSLARERAERLAELKWPLRGLHSFLQQWEELPQVQAQKEAQLTARRAGRHYRQFAEEARAAWPEKRTEAISLISLGALLLWPSAWVLWAFVARGGIAYRLAGIRLVRADGRPAWRLQCLWRAFLVWAPVAGLFVLSWWLDERYWSAWPDPARRQALWWLDAVSAACWWAAWLTLASYAALALRNPSRSLHDRLAGTYLVPR